MAKAVKAEKLAFLTDVEGLYRDFEDKNSLISEMMVDEAQEFINSGSLGGGMLPKLQNCVDAIKEAGELFDIEVIDLHTLTGLNPNDKECADQYFHNSGSIDNLHPNAKGHLVIAETICRHLLKA